KGRRAPPSRFPAFQKRTSASEIHLAVMSSSRPGDLLEIDFHAWPHRRADAELVHELAFRARRPGLHDGVDKGREIGLEVFLGEARLADASVDDAGFLDPE